MNRYLIAACLCSGGWQESLEIIVFVVVWFLYILNAMSCYFLWTVMSRKLVLLLVSFSMENCMVGIVLLNCSSTKLMSVSIRIKKQLDYANLST